MKKLLVILCAILFVFSVVEIANAIGIFYEDFDGDGLGFENWAIRSEVPAAGSWDLFNPDAGDGNNHTSGTDKYAGDSSLEIDFSFYSAFGGSKYDTIQTDNIMIESAPVPEPATMLLLGTGLIGLAGFGRRKIKKK